MVSFRYQLLCNQVLNAGVGVGEETQAVTVSGGKVGRD